MKKIANGIRVFCVISCVLSIAFYTSLSYAQDNAPSISMDFQEVALKDVLKVFSQQAGLNFVATKEIENKMVTLYLNNVTVQDALDSIIEANNLTYEQKPDSSVFVVKESFGPRVKMITKVYNLNYAKVSTSDNAFSKSSGSASEGRGFPLGTSSASANKSSKGASAIDSVISNLLTKNSAGKPLGSIVVDQRTNSIIITSVPEDFPLIESTLAKLDAQTPQVMIQAEIIEVKTTAIKNLGLEWGSTTDGTFFTFTGPTRDTGFPFVMESGILSRSLLGGSIADSRGRSLSTSSTGNTFGNLSLTQFQILLKALEKDNNAKYLAKPKIMVLSNESAEIRISADTAVGTTTDSQTDTGTLSTSAERVETGVILKVTPTVNKDDYITMTLEPEVSRVETSNISGYYDPTKRSAKTTVMMKHGQTIAIGGLLKNDLVDNNRNVPGLSKIPLLGNLFKSKAFEDTSTEIIIFVTCTIIKPELEKKEIVSASIENQKEATATERDNEILRAVKRLRKKRELK